MAAGPLRLLCAALLASACVLLCGGVAATGAVVECVRGADCVLQCLAEPVEGAQYRALRWYRVTEAPSSKLSGILTRDLPDGRTTYHVGLDREVELLDESLHLLLPNVTCSDGGVYTCHLDASVGQQNREGRVLLALKDCPHGSTDRLTPDDSVILATAVLVVALIIFLISFISLRSVLRDRKDKSVTKETLLDATLKPLEKKDLMLIYTLGPKTSSMKHVCV